MVSEAEFNENVQDIDDKTTEMNDGINKCIDKFNNNDWGMCADDDLIEKIGGAMDRMQQVFGDLAIELGQLASPGWPFWFLESKDSWLTVKSELSGQLVYVQSASASSFPASQSWVGREGAVYRDMPGVQADAISGVVGYAGSFATHLGDHGLQIIDLWVDLAMAFIDYAQLVATSVGNFLSADPTKWLNIVDEIITTISNLVDFVQGIVVLVKDKWVQTKSQMFTLENELADLSGSVAGKWPTIALLS
ncbi:hypothetical protein [Microbacterium sp. 18062]|uniref:hypothetical protein n=1 Tax=Microbacterium sp. 18062 TaxID=2681410 RepID=UPI00135AC23A|nr:hypothetical protein [Microbacterium sp. 18062]